MPFHLVPTRRQFIGSSLGLGLGLLAHAAPKADPHAMAILADTHVGEDRKQVMRNVCMAEHAEAVVAEILAWKTRPGGIILNGDCARLAGLPGDYAVLAKILGPLMDAQLPLHLTMGNHDNRAPFYDAFSSLRPNAPPLVDKIVSVLETPRANWYFLDSLDQVNVTPGK
ncbi:MAG: Icc protein, partial [Rhodothermales bacterium]